MSQKQRTLAILAIIATRKHGKYSAYITGKNSTSTQAMVSAFLFESRSIILDTVQHFWKYVLWLYSDSKKTWDLNVNI